MHETLDKDIKGYVDELKFNGTTVMVAGWAFHGTNKQVYPLRVVSGNNSVNITRLERTDVSTCYKIQGVTYCGFNFSTKIETSISIQMNVENTWVDVFIFSVPADQVAEVPAPTVIPATAVVPVTTIVPVTADVEQTFTPKLKSIIPTSLVVDDFYESPNDVRKFALSCEFNEHKEYHKGRRTNECYRFSGLKERFEQLLGRKIKNWTNYGTNGCFQHCIAGEQLVFHYDQQQYAGIIYLSPNAPPHSGTTLYRSRYTKKMKVANEESSLVFRNGYLDSTEFDVVDVIGNVYNRLILFDAQIIHAASAYFGTTKENSRLFQLFFFDLE